MRIRDLLRPRPHGYLGLRTLSAFLAVLALGFGLYLVGVIAPDRVARGVGVLFIFIGIAYTVALLLRWLIFRRIT